VKLFTIEVDIHYTLTAASPRHP